MTPLPISTITKVFHPRIVPIPNATITELRITELFYYGLLLPNVAHSKSSEIAKQFGFQSSALLNKASFSVVKL